MALKPLTTKAIDKPWLVDRSTNRYAILTGAGFSESRPTLDRIAMDLAGGTSPKICFVPTASGDAQGYITRFNDAFTEIASIPTHLPLFQRGGADPRSILANQDVIYPRLLRSAPSFRAGV